ncbi:MAG: flagellar export protein FliJ [Nitrospirae bacterium]|nr:flagellar export protein FliJ [Nitrospirota bacterium]MCL5062575.1 flagellar export protein FliJ [Nitrospirota bacterium]MDA8213803.1 flagellar export protein FliJ [Nitrospiraceae bacterium]MDA8339147.1 flagellar export protein FliJ [Nitrospiraceae bacterium]
MRTPLESLLNIKRWKEDEAKNRFAILLKELSVEEKRLYDLEEQYNSVSKKLECNTDELVNIDEIRKLNEYLEHLLIRIHQQKKVIADKEKQVEESRRSLVEASKEKKIFEKLDEKQKSASKKELKRKEQIGTDEHAATGHHRKKGS